MTVGVMQPYFFPYEGYFQLMGAVDAFVVYDDIQYTKRGWVNRNRLLGSRCDPETFSLPVANAREGLEIREREVAASYSPSKLKNAFRGRYAKAPFWTSVSGLLDEVLACPQRNLFAFLVNSLEMTCAFMGLDPTIVVSSTVGSQQGLRGSERVLDLVTALGGSRYVNPPGGRSLYDAHAFRDRGVELLFLEPHLLPYQQGECPFVKGLSILDVLLWIGPDAARERVSTAYSLIPA